MTIVLGSLIVFSTLVGGSDPGRSPAPEQEKSAPASAAGDAAAIRQRVKENQKVRVIDDQGREWHGRIAALTPDSMTMITKNQERRDVPYGTILRIDRPHDGLANGAGIGFVTGAAFGFLAVLSEESAECEPGGFWSCGDPTAGAYAVVPAVFGGLGAAIGVGVDALIRRDGNLWRRSATRVSLAPSAGRGMRGLQVSVRW